MVKFYSFILQKTYREKGNLEISKILGGVVAP